MRTQPVHPPGYEPVSTTSLTLYIRLPDIPGASIYIALHHSMECSKVFHSVRVENSSTNIA